MSVLKDSISKVIKVDRNTHFETEGISLAIGFFDGLMPVSDAADGVGRRSNRENAAGHRNREINRGRNGAGV